MDKDQPLEETLPPQICTPLRCTDDENLNRLECKKCKRSVHYECTQLPLYQLQIFVTSYNDQYLCSKCVRITKNLRSKVGNNTHHMMQQELQKKDDIIKKLKSKVDSKNLDSIKNDLETFLSGKLREMEEMTKNMIKNEIKNTAEIMKETTKRTYAEITNMHKEDVNSAEEQKRKNQIEKKDIESRKLNIIIHGLHDYSDKADKVNVQKYDKSQIQEILEDINVPVVNVTHHRIGDSTKEKNRPLKVTLQNQHDKELIMKNLYKLKETIFDELSITEDFTIKERKKIKEIHEKAKKLNEEIINNDFKWRVRGSPRTNLRLIKKFLIKPKKSSNCRPKPTLEDIEWTSSDDEE